jgi:hypothetical protein
MPTSLEHVVRQDLSLPSLRSCFMLLHSALDQRSRRHPHWTFTVIVAVLVAVPPRAALAQVSDVKGSKDHTMVSRYAGSVIIGYDFRKFDEFVIPLGALRRAGDRPAAGGGTTPYSSLPKVSASRGGRRASCTSALRIVHRLKSCGTTTSACRNAVLRRS